MGELERNERESRRKWYQEVKVGGTATVSTDAKMLVPGAVRARQDLGCAELAVKTGTPALAEIQGRSSSYDLDEAPLVAGMA